MIRSLLGSLALLGCTHQQTFEERAQELEAEAPIDCGTVTLTCGTEQQVVAIVECVRGHLAAGTGARALRPYIDRETYVYAIEGELFVLDRTFDEDLVWRWSERRCRRVGWHEHSATCWGFEPFECD
jgi:hypothetical protein